MDDQWAIPETDEQRRAWWRGLTQAERLVYARPRHFVATLAANVPRYRDRYRQNQFAARAAMRKVLGDKPFPNRKCFEDGMARVRLYRGVAAWATIRDAEEAAAEAAKEK